MSDTDKNGGPENEQRNGWRDVVAMFVIVAAPVPIIQITRDLTWLQLGRETSLYLGTAVAALINIVFLQWLYKKQLQDLSSR